MTFSALGNSFSLLVALVVTLGAAVPCALAGDSDVSLASAALPAAACDNAALLDHPALLLVVPHPDDEVVGLGGLLYAFTKAGKPVTVVVATDGDAACGACRFWRNAGPVGEECSNEELRAFGHARRDETLSATALLGHPSVQFLGFPDGSLGQALDDGASHPDEPLRRAQCRADSARARETPHTPGELMRLLQTALAATPPGTLVATSDPEASHPDHAALGRLVARLNAELPDPRPLVFASVHPLGTVGQATDCSYPAPAAQDCSCAERTPAFYSENPQRIGEERAHRYRPDEALARPPRDGTRHALTLCVAPELTYGPEPLEREALDRFATQIGTASMDGRPIPDSLRGLVDCVGYMSAFVKRTEVLFPAAADLVSSVHVPLQDLHPKLERSLHPAL